VPNCRAYDPAFAYEFAVILDHGMREMLEQQRDAFYYVTLTNENVAQPSMPAGVERDIVRGLYRVTAIAATHASGAAPMVRLVASGAMLREALAAAKELANDWSVAAEVWSATSFSELAREATECERWNRLHPTAAPRVPHVATSLAGGAPVIAASDNVRAWPQLIAPHCGAMFTALGTDGFGRSDTRAELRAFFEVDRQHIVVAALHALARQGRIEASQVARAIERHHVDADAPAPWTR